MGPIRPACPGGEACSRCTRQLRCSSAPPWDGTEALPPDSGHTDYDVVHQLPRRNLQPALAGSRIIETVVEALEREAMSLFRWFDMRGVGRAERLPKRLDSLIFEVTQRCNHDCLHCYNVWKNASPYPSGELTTTETLRMLDMALEETEATHLSLTGGEPLLRADLFEIIDHLRGRGITLNLVTNGALLDSATIERLLPDAISVFELPLLSAQRDIHDRMSGAPGAFDKATLAMAQLKATRQRVVGVFVATKPNLPTWRETIDLAFAMGLDGLMFNRFNPGGRGGKNVELLQASPAELTAALDVAEEMSARYGIHISCSIPMPPCLFDVSRYTRLSFGLCAAGTERSYFTLDPLGNLRPCNHSPRILGNILHTDFRHMVVSDTMAEFIQAHPAFCVTCDLGTSCQGGCKASAEACFGSPQMMDPFLRAFHRQAARRQMPLLAYAPRISARMAGMR
jgi:radical SAM protein with 4Fe4S-binding SPASM domain